MSEVSGVKGFAKWEMERRTANREEALHYCSLRIKHSEGREALCGCAVIDEYFVLTAKHCVQNLELVNLPSIRSL